MPVYINLASTLQATTTWERERLARVQQTDYLHSQMLIDNTYQVAIARYAPTTPTDSGLVLARSYEKGALL